MSSLFLMVTITDRRSTDAFLQLYQQRGVDVNLRTVGFRMHCQARADRPAPMHEVP